MKKVFLFLAVILMAATAKAEEWIEVSTAQDFINVIKGNASANVRLTADINLAEVKLGDWEVFNEFTFKGKLTGEKRDGSNYTITSNGQTNGSILFEKVEGATISHITFKKFKWDGGVISEKIAVVARESSSGTYENLKLVNCAVIDASDEIGGFVAISKSDKFTNCTTTSDCSFEGSNVAGDTNVGGIVSKAYNSTFTLCCNGASVKGNDNQEAGIAAYSSGCTFDRCLNAGTVKGDSNSGGIVGNAANQTVIKRCVNIGTLDYGGSGSTDKRGGIAGLLQDKGSCVVQCLNFGDIEGASNKYGEIVGGRENGATEWRVASNHCYYYCQYNGSHADNESMYSDNSIYRWAKIQSGEFAFKSTVDEAGSERWLYQDIDAWLGSEQDPFASKYPVPVPEAGVVHSNILCDGTQSYSNVYQSTSAHTSTPDNFGFCTVCGMQATLESGIHISTSEDFRKLLYLFNNGIDINNTIRLDNDIDISGMPASTKGYLFGREFTGVLDGQGHALMNSIHPLFLRTYTSHVQSLVLDGFSVNDATSLIARTSGCSNFIDVTVKNSRLDTNDAGSNIGLIAGYSDNDHFLNCKTDSTCTIYPLKACIGGIVGYLCDGGTVESCHNAANISSTNDTDNYAGGIAGRMIDSSIRNSLNTGFIFGGHLQCGGIAGSCEAKNQDSEIYNCVNTGTVRCFEVYAYVGGIIGATDNSNSFKVKLENCMNFGTITNNPQKENNQVHEICGKIGNSAYYITTNVYYHCVIGPEGTLHSNLAEMGTSIDEMMSGKFAFDHSDWLYQDIDNNTFETHYPAPIAKAGDVYSNILCDGTQSYSNKYQSTGAHTGECDQQGYCVFCGNYLGVAIQDADALCKFAKAVNNGEDYSNTTVYLSNDIDMSSVTDYTPIGTNECPYSGTFDGQGHRIKNLVFPSDATVFGLFGRVAGKATLIKNVIIDSTCVINCSDKACAAGLVGCVYSYDSTACNVTIENCGNEADIEGYIEEAGLVGNVYGNDEISLTFKNCYNTGDISGFLSAAAFCSYSGNCNSFSFINCYNSGKITGGNGSQYFLGGQANASFVNCYGINDSQEDVTKITAEQIVYGELCLMLNADDSTVFMQDLANDSYPVLGSEGLHYTRTMSNQWGTICLPFDADADASTSSAQAQNYTFYELSGVTEDMLTLTKVSGTLQAGTPAIVKRSAEATGIDVPASGTAFAETPLTGSSASGLTLKGTYTTLDISNEEGYFIKDNAFWNIQDTKGDGSVKIGPYRAYLAGSLSSGVRWLNISTDTDGIAEVLNGSNGSSGLNGEIYDLGGHRLNSLQQGVNIIKLQNGKTKKVIIK